MTDLTLSRRLLNEAKQRGLARMLAVAPEYKPLCVLDVHFVDSFVPMDETSSIRQTGDNIIGYFLVRYSGSQDLPKQPSYGDLRIVWELAKSSV